VVHPRTILKERSPTVSPVEQPSKLVINLRSVVPSKREAYRCLIRLERDLLAKPWQEVRPGVQVKLLPQDGELYLLRRVAIAAPRNVRWADTSSNSCGSGSRTLRP
jgi:hypothetical protein